jgi:DNA-binding HxlR family transcriptional regulator
MSHSHIDVSSLASEACPVSEVLDHVSGKWSIGILVAVAQGPVRFTELERSIRGISRRMLTLTLRKLERDGLLVRTVYPVVPPKVEYTLTEMAKELHQSLLELTDWARRHGSAVAAAQAAYDREQIPALPAGCTRDPGAHRTVNAEGGWGGVVGRPGAEGSRATGWPPVVDGDLGRERPRPVPRGVGDHARWVGRGVRGSTGDAVFRPVRPGQARSFSMN